MRYLKIINTVWKNNESIVKQIVLGTQKWHYKSFLVGQAAPVLLINNHI